MEPHSPRFSDTPPGSPKSCMKGSRKLTFDKPAESSSSSVGTGTRGDRDPSPIPSPKKSPKSVSIRMHHDDEGSGSTSSQQQRGTSFDHPSSSQQQSAAVQKKPPPAEIQFQFQLTEHFDQSTPPPNCTSNGNYDFDEETTKKNGAGGGSSDNYTSGGDPRQDPQLVEIANKFVNDIIEKAKVEAANRAKAEDTRRTTPGTSDRDSFANGMGGAAPWYRRAHGLVSKWITNICVRAQNIRADLK